MEGKGGNRLNPGDVVYFDYTDSHGDKKVRIGEVETVDRDDAVLIWDYIAIDEKTGQHGAYRSSKVDRMRNVHLLQSAD
jgi:hypothetical protein